MRTESLRRACVALVSVSLLAIGMQTSAIAGVVGTADAIAAIQSQDDLATVRGVLARDDVRERMVALGVDPSEVDGRLAALTPAELASLADKLEQAPAGGDVLVVIGIVFVVLMILEFTGTIDIFKKV